MTAAPERQKWVPGILAIGMSVLLLVSGLETYRWPVVTGLLLLGFSVAAIALVRRTLTTHRRRRDRQH